MKPLRKYCLVPVFFILLFLTGLFSCTEKDLPVPPVDEPGIEKEIIYFSLKRSNGVAFLPSELSVDINANNILIIVPANTDRSILIPEIAINGKTISPASGVAQNFTVPVEYTVTAEDGTTAVYIVIIQLQNTGATVYIGTGDNEFLALDAETGVMRWKYSGLASFAYSGATYANETVYVGGIDGYVYAFNALNGNVRWKYFTHAHGIESDAVVVDGTVYVGSNDDHLYALNANNGTLKWRFATGGNVSASPTIADGTVYFGSSDGKLYALNATDGQMKWAYSTMDMINQSGPALKNGVIYVGSRDGFLHAVNAVDGSLKWKYNTLGFSLEQSSPTVADGKVFIGAWADVPGFTRKGGLFAVDAETGGLIWEKLTGTGISSSPTVSNGRVYITTDDFNLYALDIADGSTAWQKMTMSNSASPAVSGNTAFVGGGGTWNIYAMNAATGEERWRYPIKGLSTSCPLIVHVNGTADYSGDSGMMD